MSSSSEQHRGSRLAALLALTIVGLLVPVSGAFASTVTSNGSAVVWTADPGAGGNYVSFEETAATDLTIYLPFGDPVEYNDAGGTNNDIAPDCTDNDGTPKNGISSEVLCLGVLTITADGGAGGDELRGDGDWTGDELLTILGTFRGGLGEDLLVGGFADPAVPNGDTLEGGQGNDDVFGRDGQDKLTGGDDDDLVNGEDDEDDVEGGEGDDTVLGDDDNDTVDGDAGDDYVEGGNEADTVNGGDGSDGTNEWDDGGVDRTNGGAGTDNLYYDACDDACSNNDNLTINENGALDDGDVEEDPGNDFNGFENISFDMNGDARSTIRTGEASDSIFADTTGGLDNVDPGAGPDFVLLSDDNDTASTVDGFPDFVDCGQEQNDNDTVTADQFDELIDCESTTITQTPSAYEDPDGDPPNVDLTSPAAGATLSANAVTPLTAEATDDSGVDRVVFIDDSTILCTDTTAPYECDYEPTADDVGNNTLSAWAVDGSGQFGADFAEVTVTKFDAGLTSRTNKRDLKGRRKVNASGQLELPAGVPSEEGCEGVVRITVRDGNDTLKVRRADVRENCEWSRTITLPPVGTIEHNKVKVLSKFLGNEVVDSEKGPTRKTKVQNG